MDGNLVDAVRLVAQGFTMILPIAVSGIVLIVAMKKSWLTALDRPIDFGVRWGGDPLIGSSKTIRGFVVHVLVATAVTAILHVFADSAEWIAPQYRADPFLLGVSNTGVYVLGEMINSFVKRRLGIAPGATATSRWGARLQRFVDNVDGTLLSGVYLLVVYRVTVDLLLTGFVIAYGTHLSTDALMRRLRLKHRQQ